MEPYGGMVIMVLEKGSLTVWCWRRGGGGARGGADRQRARAVRGRGRGGRGVIDYIVTEHRTRS